MTDKTSILGLYVGSWNYQSVAATKVGSYAGSLPIRQAAEKNNRGMVSTFRDNGQWQRQRQQLLATSESSGRIRWLQF
jgi:hypothetical protein